jgi:hypothetical protein
MTLPKVGILHRPGAAAGLSEIYKSAQGVCEPVLFIHASAAGNAGVLEVARSLFRTEVVSEAELAPACRGLGVAGLTAFHDLDLDLLDTTLQELALPGVGTVAQPWDKLVQRQRIPAALSVPAVAVESADTFGEAVSRIGLPAVLKPRRATGGAGLAFLHDTDDIAYQLAHRSRWDGYLLEAVVPPGRHPSGAGYLADFVSVETLNTATGRIHAAVFDKIPVTVWARRGVDGADLVSVSGDIVPTRLDERDTREVVEAVDVTLSALGVRSRVTHTEVKLGSEGPVIIEVNGRVGGHLNRLLSLLDGSDLVRAALQLALGLDPDIVVEPRRGYAMGYYPSFPEPAEQVRSNVTARQVRALPSVTAVTELAKHGQDRQATSNRMANVLLRADDLATLDAAAAALEHGLRALFAEDLTGSPEPPRG